MEPRDTDTMKDPSAPKDTLFVEDQKEELPRESMNELVGSNFDLHGSCIQPSIEPTVEKGEMVGLSKKGELRRFEYDAKSREIERELADLARALNYNVLDNRLLFYYRTNSDSASDPLKYIIAFYKVLLKYETFLGSFFVFEEIVHSSRNQLPNLPHTLRWRSSIILQLRTCPFDVSRIVANRE